MGKHYSIEFKEKIIKEYKSKKYGGRYKVAEIYGIPHNTIYKWIVKDREQGNQENDIEHKRGKTKYEQIDYKERYEILKKYQAFLKARRERK